MDIPNSWHGTITFLIDEQQKLRQAPAVAGGLGMAMDEVDMLCLQYSSSGFWPTMTTGDKTLVFQRLLWARQICATLSSGLRKADGTQSGHLPYPTWDFESMMIWLLLESWRLRESILKGDRHRLPPLPEPQQPDNPATN